MANCTRPFYGFDLLVDSYHIGPLNIPSRLQTPSEFDTFVYPNPSIIKPTMVVGISALAQQLVDWLNCPEIALQCGLLVTILPKPSVQDR